MKHFSLLSILRSGAVMSTQRFLPFLLIASVLTASCTRDNGPVTPSTQGAIAGRVLDAGGQPIAGAAVVTTPATQAKVTAADGQFAFDAINAGTYVVVAAKSGYSPGSVTVTVESGKTATSDIVLGSGGPVNRAPLAPHSPVPPNNATEQPTDLTLRWTSSDPDGDPLRYDIYFGTTDSPELVAVDVQSPMFDQSSLTENTRYFWRVVVRDNHGGEATSPVWSFTTESHRVIEGGLVAYYPFSGSASDASGNGLDGELEGDATFTADRNGTPRAALRVSGYGYMEAAHNSLLNFGSSVDFTATAWIKSSTYQAEFAGIVSKMVGGIDDPFSGFQIFLSGDSFGAQVETVQSRNDVFSTTQLSDGLWHQVALVVRRATGNIRLFVDGELVRNYSSSTVHADLNSTAPLFIGKDRTSNRFFVGSIDEVRIYNRALSEGDLAELR
jgi:hypothetical protein